MNDPGPPEEPSGYEVLRDGSREPFYTSLDTGEPDMSRFAEGWHERLESLGPLSELQVLECQGLHDHGVSDERIAFLMGTTANVVRGARQT